MSETNDYASEMDALLAQFRQATEQVPTVPPASPSPVSSAPIPPMPATPSPVSAAPIPPMPAAPGPVSSAPIPPMPSPIPAASTPQPVPAAQPTPPAQPAPTPQPAPTAQPTVRPPASAPVPDGPSVRVPSGRPRPEGPGVIRLSGDVDPDLVQALLDVVRLGASDLHVSGGSHPMLRVDGALRPWGPVPWPAAKVEAALLAMIDAERRAQFEAEFELDWSFALTDEARMRANFYRQRGVMGAAFRLIPAEIKPLESLGLPRSIARFAELPRGLVLVTGPTGSGKSTTLAALIDVVNRTRADHIMTVEDPIEFVHVNKRSLVNQREVGGDTKSFAAALKHVLRQDPDVILVGEMRDLETISVALTAAETGHLVFATLHTQSAPQTIDRVIDVFPPHQQEQVRAQLASTLRGVVCQTLLPRANGRGRVLAAEVMVTTPAIANLIREGKTHQVPSAMQTGGELGMQTLDQHLAQLVREGEVTHEAGLDRAQDVETFKQLIR